MIVLYQGALILYHWFQTLLRCCAALYQQLSSSRVRFYIVLCFHHGRLEISHLHPEIFYDIVKVIMLGIRGFAAAISATLYSFRHKTVLVASSVAVSVIATIAGRMRNLT